MLIASFASTTATIAVFSGLINTPPGQKDGEQYYRSNDESCHIYLVAGRGSPSGIPLCS